MMPIPLALSLTTVHSGVCCICGNTSAGPSAVLDKAHESLGHVLTHMFMRVRGLATSRWLTVRCSPLIRNRWARNESPILIECCASDSEQNTPTPNAPGGEGKRPALLGSQCGLLRSQCRLRSHTLFTDSSSNTKSLIKGSERIS